MLDSLMGSKDKKKDSEHDKVDKTLEQAKNGVKDKPPQLISASSLFGEIKNNIGHGISVVSSGISKSIV